ncbi:MAG: hypothetical protein A2V74_04425 [Acidobacteria bacterium RBG_16_70_10]|nr:MAG: hypothetical protein A2V74_04425 [Acidobacteria bacterium RBG_16_70_10]
MSFSPEVPCGLWQELHPICPSRMGWLERWYRLARISPWHSRHFFVVSLAPGSVFCSSGVPGRWPCTSWQLAHLLPASW